jgi:hypothetical protein
MDADPKPRPRNQNLSVRSNLAIVLAIATITSGCSTLSTPVAATELIDVPIRFIDAQGDAMTVKDRPDKWRAALGAVSGAIYGPPSYPPQTTQGALGRAETVQINLPVVRAMLDQESATITVAAAKAGLKIEPAATRFARLATAVVLPQSERRPLGIGFVDSYSKRKFTLVFFDRPCRVTGTLVSNKGTETTVDVIIEKAGLGWLEIPEDGTNTHVTNAGMPSHLIFVVQPPRT